MPHAAKSAPSVTREEMLDRVRALAPKFATRAAAGEEARQLPDESARDLLAAGVARIMVPVRFGGAELGVEAWFDIVREISKADASHGWCASLYGHHPTMVAQFPEEAQQAVWADGPDVAIAGSLMPKAQVVRADGGYIVSGQQSVFASGVAHSAWAMVGGFVRDGGGAPDWLFFLLPRRDYTIRDTWFVSGMRATGSNTIVTENVFVPEGRVLRVADLKAGCGPGGAVNTNPIFRAPFYSYAPIGFVAPMLGAAQGAYEQFRDWTKTRETMTGASVAEKTSTQVRMARVAANLDAAELLLRRAAQQPEAGSVPPQIVARSVRDFARASELIQEAIDALIGLSGTAGFAMSHPLQRAWRDIHFASSHISLNTESNYSHFGRMELGRGRDPNHPFL